MIVLLAFVLGEVIAVLKMGKAAVFLMLPIMVIIKIITKKQVGVFVVIFLFVFLGFSVSNYAILRRDMMWQLEEKNVVVTGSVSKIENNDYGQDVFLENVLIKESQCGEVLVFFEKTADLKIGNVIEVKGRIKHFERAHNEGNFDARNYYMSLGIFTKIVAKEYEVKNSSYDQLRDCLFQLRIRIAERFSKICNQKGIGYDLREGKEGVFSAIILGDKSELDVETKELYSVSGIAHILAISGLHIQIMGMFIYGRLRKKFSFGVSSFFSILFVTGFGIISGFGIATVRAFVMFALRLIGEVFGRTYDSLTAMSLAAILLLLKNPFIIVNSGFQMSFAAIISITIVWKKVVYILQLDEKEEKGLKISKQKILLRKIKKSILCSLTISIFMNPIVAYNYFSLPTYSFLLNVVVVPLMSVVVVSGVAGIAFSYIGIEMAGLALFPGCFVLEVYEKMSKCILKIPFSNVIVGKPDKVIIFMYYLLIVIFILVLEQRRKRKLKERGKKKIDIPQEGRDIRDYIENKNDRKEEKVFGIFLMLLVILLDILLYEYIPAYTAFIQKNQLIINAMDVGQGDGLVIRTPNNKVLMVDGGSTSIDELGKYRIIPFLKSECIREIDYAIMTHADMDHISGLIELIKESDGTGIQVKHLVLPDIRQKDENYHQMIKIAKEHGVSVLYITKGNSMTFGDVEVKCIYPDLTTQAEDRNDYSTILDVTYHKFSMLLTGDISSKCEPYLKDMLKKHYTVLKVAHHGSKYSTSSEFLQQINPDYSVISVGEHNLYGHPSRETLERLKENGSQILRTDESGEITITTDGEAMRIGTVVE